MPGIARWKMVDNLRRTMSAPLTLATLVAAWTLPSIPAGLWTAFVLASVIVPAALPVLPGLLPRRQGISKRSHLRAVGADVALAAAQVGLALHVPRAPGVADGRRDPANPGAAVCHPAEPPRMDDRRPGQGQPRPRPRGVLPADGGRRRDRGRHRGPRPRREAGRGLDRRAVRRAVAALAPRRPMGQPATPRIGRSAALGRRRRGTPPDRPPDLALLRDLRRPGGPCAAARQLPGRSQSARRTSHVPDEHRGVPAGDRDGSRLRLDRDARDGGAPGGDARDHRQPRTVPRAPVQLVRHARPAPARAGLRVVGRQRQSRRPPARAVQRLSPDDRPAAPGRRRTGRDR